MKWPEIVAKARSLGLKTTAVKKTELIRRIQKAEGHFDCYGTATHYCDQWRCCFRGDCLPSDGTIRDIRGIRVRKEVP